MLDYAGRAEELAQHANPVALLVVSHLQAQQTRQDDLARVQAKIALIKNLSRRGLDVEEMRHWYRYLDWLLPLSREQDRLVWQEI